MRRTRRVAQVSVFAIAAVTWVCQAHAGDQPPAEQDEPVADDTAEDDTAEEYAEEDATEEDGGAQEGPPEIYDISVFGEAEDVARVGGPAHRIREEELERFEDDNVHRILPRVPGVYLRGEDGYGLRPNIGMRGVSSDRSSKVNLLEDGVLLGPAPYSAPAAYFFPLMTRMTGVEVFKGPSAIRHGPNTIGGTINFMTRPVPYRHRIGLDLAAGGEGYAKGHGHYGYGAKHWGVLIEGVRIRSGGFKELDTAESRLGGNTGFDKLEIMGKARINTDPGKALYNEGSIKLTVSREVSNETYLGLTDADFAVNPYRRYAASARDQMRYQRFAVSASHALIYQTGLRPTFTLRTTVYRHDFTRAWRKLNGIAGAQPLEVILADPTATRAVFYELLKGADTQGARLLIGTNDRTFVSQGVQTSAAWRLPALGALGQRLQAGVRLHNDSIERLHTDDTFAMRAGVPEPDGGPTITTTENMGETVALAGYLIDEISLGPVLLTPGVRLELINTHFEDHLTGANQDGVQRVILPGVGAVYQPIDSIAILGGVHMGFSPVVPGQPADIQPEVATNYELGARFSTQFASIEATRFISAYSNLSGLCTFSAGCSEREVDGQFNADDALITGVETAAKMTIPTPIDLELPVTLTYTYTRTKFLTSFETPSPQLPVVRAGDELPSVPRHQAAATMGFLSEAWGGLSFSFTYVDGMREKAGSGTPPPGEVTDSMFVIDAAAKLNVTKELAIYGKVENLLNNAFITSRRPFGARPGRPRFIYGGVKILFDR